MSTVFEIPFKQVFWLSVVTLTFACVLSSPSSTDGPLWASDQWQTQLYYKEAGNKELIEACSSVCGDVGVIFMSVSCIGIFCMFFLNVWECKNWNGKNLDLP